MGIIDRLIRLINTHSESDMDDEDFEPVYKPYSSERVKHEYNEPNMDRMPRFASIQVVKPKLNENGYKNYSIRNYADMLKEHNALVLDISEVVDSNLEFACRLIDFLAGVTLALGGMSRKISDSLFLFAPSNFIIGGDMQPIEAEYED